MNHSPYHTTTIYIDHSNKCEFDVLGKTILFRDYLGTTFFSLGLPGADDGKVAAVVDSIRAALASGEGRSLIGPPPAPWSIDDTRDAAHPIDPSAITAE